MAALEDSEKAAYVPTLHPHGKPRAHFIHLSAISNLSEIPKIKNNRAGQSRYILPPVCHYFLKPLESLGILSVVCIWMTARLYLAILITALQNSPSLPSSLFPLPPLPRPISFFPRLLLSEFRSLLRENILATQVYGYRKEESLKGKAGRDPQLYNQLLSKHNKPQPDTSCSDRMQDHKDDGDLTDRHFMETHTFPANR